MFIADAPEYTIDLIRPQADRWRGVIAAELEDGSVGAATILNCLYAMSHLPVPKWLGCTGGIRSFEGRFGTAAAGLLGNNQLGAAGRF